MTFQPRSHYEFGDPIAETIAKAEHTDHYKARARGQRLLRLADSIVSVLDAAGLLVEVTAARREIFHVLGDALYGLAALDIPDFTNLRSLDALRRGRSDADGLDDA